MPFAYHSTVLRTAEPLARFAHDHKRNGTTPLFVALNTIEGKVIGRYVARHRHQEFIGFLGKIERAVPARKIIHAIAVSAMPPPLPDPSAMTPDEDEETN